MKPEEYKDITNFLFEIGTLRKIPRFHRQTLLTDDLSDTISSHTYRVTWIGWFLAKIEKVDPYKVVMMCLVHDMPEARSNDHNWIHKRYIKIFEDEIRADQLGKLPFDDLENIASEYDERESAESKVAKEADLLDQILLLREYEWQGNKEANRWLYGPNGEHLQIEKMKTTVGRELAEMFYTCNPSDWWKGLHTSVNR